MKQEIRIKTRKVGPRSYSATFGGSTSEGTTKWKAVKRLLSLLGSKLQLKVEFFDLENGQVEARLKDTEDNACAVGITDGAAERRLRSYIVFRNPIYVDGEPFYKTQSNITGIIEGLPKDLLAC